MALDQARVNVDRRHGKREEITTVQLRERWRKRMTGFFDKHTPLALIEIEILISKV